MEPVNFAEFQKVDHGRGMISFVIFYSVTCGNPCLFHDIPVFVSFFEVYYLSFRNPSTCLVRGSCICYRIQMSHLTLGKLAKLRCI